MCKEKRYTEPCTQNSQDFFVDQNLDWGVHIDLVIEKSTSGIAILQITANHLPLETVKTKIRSLIEGNFQLDMVTLFVVLAEKFY